MSMEQSTIIELLWHYINRLFRLDLQQSKIIDKKNHSAIKNKDKFEFDPLLSKRWVKDDRLIVTYPIPEGKGNLVQEKGFYDELKKDPEMNRRKYQSGRRGKGRAKQQTISPQPPRYEMDVEVRSILDYQALIEEETT